MKTKDEMISENNMAVLAARLELLLDEIREVGTTQLLVCRSKNKTRATYVLIDPLDVIYGESDGNDVKLTLADGEYTIRATMDALITHHGYGKFFRIHRSWFVNLNYVTTVIYRGNNECLFKMRDGTQLRSGRLYKATILNHPNITVYNRLRNEKHE